MIFHLCGPARQRPTTVYMFPRGIFLKIGHLRGSPEREDIDALIRLAAGNINWEGGCKSTAMPRHLDFAGASLNGGDDLVGDGLINIQTIWFLVCNCIVLRFWLKTRRNWPVAKAGGQSEWSANENVNTGAHANGAGRRLTLCRHGHIERHIQSKAAGISSCQTVFWIMTGYPKPAPITFVAFGTCTCTTAWAIAVCVTPARSLIADTSLALSLV